MQTYNKYHKIQNRNQNKMVHQKQAWGWEGWVIQIIAADDQVFMLRQVTMTKPMPL